MYIPPNLNIDFAVSKIFLDHFIQFTEKALLNGQK